MKLADIKAGVRVELDDRFTCMKEGVHTVAEDKNGLFIQCSEGHHYLEGQEDDETGELVGIIPCQRKDDADSWLGADGASELLKKLAAQPLDVSHDEWPTIEPIRLSESERGYLVELLTRAGISNS